MSMSAILMEFNPIDVAIFKLNFQNFLENLILKFAETFCRNSVVSFMVSPHQETEFHIRTPPGERYSTADARASRLWPALAEEDLLQLETSFTSGRLPLALRAG